LVNDRWTSTTRASRSMSRHSSASHSAGRKPSGSGEDHHRPVTGRELRRDGIEFRPGLKRALFPAPRRRVIHAELRRVGLDHPPEHRPREHLAKGLSRVEAIPGREPDPPRGDLLRPDLADWSLPESSNRLPQQPTQLLNRHRLNIVLYQVSLHEFGQRQRLCESPLPPQPIQLTLQRLRRVPLRHEPATLYPLRAAAATPVAVRPQRLSVLTSAP
jgi:hypothetical protein